MQRASLRHLLSVAFSKVARWQQQKIKRKANWVFSWFNAERQQGGKKTEKKEGKLIAERRRCELTVVSPAAWVALSPCQRREVQRRHLLTLAAALVTSEDVHLLAASINDPLPRNITLPHTPARCRFCRDWWLVHVHCQVNWSELNVRGDLQVGDVTLLCRQA